MGTGLQAGKPALAIALSGIVLAASPSSASAAPIFQAGLEAGVLSGLDSLARGGEAGFDLALAFGEHGDRGRTGGEGRASVGVAASAAWDASLDSAFAAIDLRLGFGPSLSISCGWEFPLGDPRLSIPEASTLAHLGCADLPNRLALEARLARFLAGDGRRPSLNLVAGLSWSAYRVLSTDATGSDGGSGTMAANTPAQAKALAEALAGKAGFAAGLRARIMLELRWGGP